MKQVAALLVVLELAGCARIHRVRVRLVDLDDGTAVVIRGRFDDAPPRHDGGND